MLSQQAAGAVGKTSANVDEYVEPGKSTTVTAAGSPALTPDPILTAPTDESRAFSPLVRGATQQGGQTLHQVVARHGMLEDGYVSPEDRDGHPEPDAVPGPVSPASGRRMP